ncbi:MAG TPA: PorV/PorQ family protein [bacterium]
MRHKLLAALLISTILLIVVSGYAQTNRKTGIAGASILKVGVGAKAVAIGSAVTTITGDVNQLFWNPAGISLPDGKTQVTFSYNQWIADLNHNAFAVGHSFGKWGTVALGGMMSGVDDIPAIRDLQPGLKDVEYATSETFGYNATVIGLSYAKQFTDKLSMGLTAKYYGEKIDVETISAFAVDFGAIYFIGYRDLAIGARIQNIGSDLKYYYVPFSLPIMFSFGTSMSMIKSDVLDLKGLVDIAKPIDGEQMVLTGVEATLVKNIFFRTGYKFNYQDIKDKFGARNSYQRIENVTRDHWWDQKEYARTDEGLSFGVGIQLPYDQYTLCIDYTNTSFSLLDNVNRFSLSFKF